MTERRVSVRRDGRLRVNINGATSHALISRYRRPTDTCTRPIPRRGPASKKSLLLGGAGLLLLAWMLWEAAPDEMLPLIPESLFFLLTLVLIGIVSIVMLNFEAQRQFSSLHVVHWTFVYLFLFIAPAIQFRMGRFPWGHLSADQYDLLALTNMAILLWSCAWILSRLLQIRVLKRLRFVPGPTVSLFGIQLAVVLAVLVAIFLVYSLGLENLLFRGRFTAEFDERFGSGPMAQITYFCLRGIPVAAFAGVTVILLRSRKVSLKSLVLLISTVGSLLVTNFPLGGARYWIGSVYLGILLLLFGNRARSNWPLVLILIGSVLWLYPRFGPLRDPGASWHPEVLATDFYDSVSRGDFDAYTMIAHTIDYVRNEGVTYGRQLLGAVLFWVPRKWWDEKPVGSGWVVADSIGLPWRNVSSPLIAEGLINFGWLGIGAFSFLYSWLLGYVERWSHAMSELRPVPLVVVLYPFLHGFVFFQMRGDLLSSTAYMVAFVVSFTPLIVGSIRCSWRYTNVSARRGVDRR